MAKFTEGQSGNPKGRPVGLERRLRDEVKGDIPALIEVLREIALGKAISDAGGVIVRTASEASNKDRIAAVKELFDRVLGKPRQSVEVSSEGPAMLLEVLGLTTAQRKRREAELEREADESEPAEDLPGGADPG